MIEQIATELTFRCNARCPACHRQRLLRVDLNDPIYTITLERFKQLFHPELLNNLKWLVFNGNYGDSVMNKDFREILRYIKQHPTRVLIHTNGAIHGKEYWTDVGNILTSSDIINFALDGLSDTHATYRVNTVFENVLENAKTVIATNRPKVHWKYIVFDYNEHQVDEAKALAKDLGFGSFDMVKTNRSFHPSKTEQYQHIKIRTKKEDLEEKIHCIWSRDKKWYVSPNGLVFRCCWTGSHYYDIDNSKFYYPKHIEDLFNGFNVPIEKIISYDYWNKLDKVLQHYSISPLLCKRQCGGIVSTADITEVRLNG